MKHSVTSGQPTSMTDYCIINTSEDL